MIVRAGGWIFARQRLWTYVPQERCPEAQIRQLAAKHYGHVTRGQLRALGVPARTIQGRVESGALVRVHSGVYAVGYRRVEPIALAAAALLACGDGAVLSHGSAAALWTILKYWPREPEVIVAGNRQRPGIRVHRSTTLTPADVTWQLGVHVTTPARTLRDIRGRMAPSAWTRAVNDAHARRLLSDHHAAILLGHRHNPTRSELEDTFQRFVTRHHLPQPQYNVTVAGQMVDALFAPQRVIVELDGYDTHGTRSAFETDRERDAILAADGYLVVRITWVRLTEQPKQEAARLRQILAQRDRGL